MKQILFSVLFMVSTLLSAQNNRLDSLPLSLKTVEIAAARLTITDVRAPLAVTVLDQRRLQTATQQLSLHEALGSIPGVFAMNPDNFSQDLRISIRGFGARAAFGIRGIRMFVDGLPEGTPDGQVDVDNLDLGIIRQMEVIRGPASGLYGNASGGVIYLLTENPLGQKPLLEAQVGAGSYGFQRYQMKLGQRFGKFLYFVNGSVNRTDAYRKWSQMRNTILNGKMAYQFSEATKLTLLGNFGNSPTANDPGALTKEQVGMDPRQAGASNVLFETGEAVRQGRIGATFETRVAQKHTFSARSFYTTRTLLNRLAIASNGYGDLQRHYYGFGVGYQLDQNIGGMPYRLKAGLELDRQTDTRKRFAYQKVVEADRTHYIQDTLALNQEESFASTGAYLLQELQPNSKILISIGLRYDYLDLSSSDRYLRNGDQSGGTHYSKINPLAGLHYRFVPAASLYANYGTSFESPTLNELGNNPEGTGGFNQALNPQQAQSFEIGAKGIAASKFRYDLAVFQIETENDIVPYQIAGQIGKTFFRNAGKTLRRGLEIGISWQMLKGLTVYGTQTFSNFKYKSYAVNGNDFGGKLLPGIPATNTQLELRYLHPKGFFAVVQGRHVGKIFANDGNTAMADAYTALNGRIGHTFSLKDWQIEPFVGANNLTGAVYMANVQINAQSDRYFEAAALQYFFGGIKIRIRQ